MDKQAFLRRNFLKTVGLGTAAGLLGLGIGQTVWAQPKRNRQKSVLGPVRGNGTNVVLITTDDLSYDSVGANGCAVPDITPNLDRLASEGVRFELAHVNIAVCQPCRGTIATGLYPHHSGITGFNHTKLPIATVMKTLKDAGYRTGIMSKVGHSTPHGAFRWDMLVNREHTCNGRDPQRFYEYTEGFIRDCAAENRPFYLMVNSQDPHRPFAGTANEYRKLPLCRHPEPSRTYQPNEVPVPGYLPDLPDVRKETARYFSSVHRADETVGAVLRALKETGAEASTLVVFISDHGRSFPFSKGNCYPFSTHVPWIMRLPGKIAPGSVEREHFISTIDFFPTVLETLDLTVPEGLDGRSFVPLLQGKPQPNRDRVFTQFYRTSAGNDYPMRSVQEKDFCYIFNPWVKRGLPYKAEAMRGLSFNAMRDAGKINPQIAARVEHCIHRTVEELYDLKKDPSCLHNLVDDAAYSDQLQRLQTVLTDWMRDTDDDALPCFDRRNEPGVCRRLYAPRRKKRSLKPRRI